MVMMLAPKKTVVTKPVAAAKHPTTKPEAGADKPAKASPAKAPESTAEGSKLESDEMPKMKTKSGAKKRFRVRGSGSIKRWQAFKRHILTKKTTKPKRSFAAPPKSMLEPGFGQGHAAVRVRSAPCHE